MKRFVKPSMLIGSILLLSACKPVDWVEKEWNAAFNDSEKKNQSEEKKNETEKKEDQAKKPDQSKTPSESNSGQEQNQKDLPWLEETVQASSDGKSIVQNPDDLLVVANKERNLPGDYEPKDLVIPNVPFPFKEDLPKKKMRKEAASALEELFKGAEDQGLELLAQSGYRSYETQVSIFTYNANQRGKEKANQVSAQPGQSEHQTGLSMDVTSPKVNYGLEEKFGETPEGKWLAENANQYGFIIRYLKGKEKVTGYSYEPWHLRYVGKEHAKEIYKRGITLEEYLDKK
ncbi:M15 family metallopeptidase [Bacillus sp. NEB1478]|uniref:M15 family metallopeptidase n=1 Tax=Bacillus sp. NEB1478 TaxID=3073816 RepID=UPI0028734938|nr:M15 family metallopeptidase [Bacillus sp. NEB1478]WNB90285.1 M15 family metallopeptidase [Bacillus sp. NEB1478]